jgi:hypothetical protein
MLRVDEEEIELSAMLSEIVFNARSAARTSSGGLSEGDRAVSNEAIALDICCDPRNEGPPKKN